MINIILLQIDSCKQSTSSSSGDFLAWFSIIATFVIGLIAIMQSYHYYKLSSKTNESTTSLLTKLNEIVIRLETVSGFMNDKVLSIFEKTMGQVTKGVFSGKGATTNDSMKKDLEKTITDSSEKIEGQIKNLNESVDKNQLNMAEVRASLNIVANAVQDVFNNVINNIDDFDECSDEYEYLKTKILERCNTDIKVTVKDIFGITSNKISIKSKMIIIERLKVEKIIDYEGENLFESTILFIVRDLTN